MSRAGRKVIRVIARLNVGGPAQNTIHLTAGLAEVYPSLLVAGQVSEGEAEMSGLARERGVGVLTIPELGREIRPWDDLVAFFRLYRLFRRERPAVVHTHTAKAGTVGRLAAVAARVPVRVHTFHGHVFEGYFGPAATRAVIFLERLLARISTRIVAISERQAADLSDRFRICERSRIRVVPLGLELDRFRPDRIAALGAELRDELGAGDEPVISIVGRLVPIKNHSLFLDAAARLTERGVRCRFAIVGGGPEEEGLRTLATKLGIADRVHFLGWRTDLERIYAGSDLVVLTSRNEGTPVCLIEALAAGRPVIATEVGGVADVLEGGRLGVLVEPGDAAAVAAAIVALLDDPERRATLGRLGAEAAPRRFGVARLITDMTELYDEILPIIPLAPSLSTRALAPTR
jgi:glycosyltransferase involved in cell wall biosynthesis